MFKGTAKKLIFSCVFLTLVLACLFYSCEMFTGDGDYTAMDTDWALSPDGRSVTLYFDGNAPPSYSGRALTLNSTKSMVNYFEVVFRYRENTSVYVNRSVDWRAGQSVGISGVYRTTTGIDYSYATATPPIGAGSALLFAGKREGDDRTLLAVGKIIKVNNTPGAIITSETVSVTFELAAIKAGTSNTDIDDSSFFTSAGASNPGNPSNVSAANTFLVPSYPVAAKDFPLYRFNTPTGPSDNIAYGIYEFGIDTVGPIQFSDYQDGIICAGAGSVYRAQPQYSQGSGPPVTTASLKIDTSTTVTMLNNTTSNVRVENPQFEFTIDPAEPPENAGRVFAFGFEIPVRNLSTSETKIWHLRPASYENREYLDDGRGGTGGTVLIGIGHDDDYTGYKLVVNSPPNKLIYNGSVGWTFDISGIALAFLRRDDSFVSNVSTSNVTFAMVENPPPNIPLTPGQNILGAPTGVKKIVVTYHSGGVDYTAEFDIICANVPNIDPDLSNVTIKSIKDESHLSSLIQGGNISGTNIWLLTGDIDIRTLGNPTSGSLQVGANAVLIIMAVNDTIKLTRSAGGANPVFNVGAGNLTIYIGRWPFSHYAIIDGYLYSTSSFMINAGNRDDIPSSSYTGALFGGNTVGKTILVSPDMAIHNVNLLADAYSPANDGRVPGSPYPQ